MKKVFSFLLYFILSTVFVLGISSQKSDSIVSYEKNSFYSTEFSGGFHDGNKFYKKIFDPVVKINIEMNIFGEKVVMGSGTGFSVKYDKRNDESYILTNDHICDAVKHPLFSRFFYEDKTIPMSYDYQYESGQLEFIKTDPSKDLCLLKTKGYIKPAKLAGRKYKVRQMDKVITVGGPSGIFPYIDEFFITNICERSFAGENMLKGEPFLFLSAMVFGGQSGSPLYNENGEVIGVIFMNLNNRYGPIYGSLAIPLSDVYLFLDN